MYRALLTLLVVGWSANVSAALVTYYDFESPNPFNDKIGTRNLTAVGAATTSTNIPINGGSQSLDVTAGGAWATHDVQPGDTISGTWTVALWANIAGPGGFGGFIGTRSGSDQSFDAKFQNGPGPLGQIHGDIGDGGSWIDTTADGSLNYSFNQWYHIAYVVTPNDYTLYLNGVFAASEPFASAPRTPLLIDPTHDLALGAVNFAGGEKLTGWIDEVRIYNSALTASEVAALVPEPSSLGLALAAALVIAAIRRR